MMGGLKPGKRLQVFNDFEQAMEQPERAGSVSTQRQQEDEAAKALGCPEAQAWLTCLACHCERTEGAKAKAGLTELLHCGTRSRSQVVAVQNRVRQQIAKVYRCASHRMLPSVSSCLIHLAGSSNSAHPHAARSSPRSWTHHMDDPPGADNPQRARQCQYLFERVLHGLLLRALKEEAEGRGGELAAKERHACVEQALEDEQLQLGLVNACVEVRSGG